jgi:predicted DNA-binding transcriptional regulator AlpA
MSRWELWNTSTIADRTGYTRRYVEEKITNLPDFPAPIRVIGETGKPRWVASEVIAWFEARRQQAA